MRIFLKGLLILCGVVGALLMVVYLSDEPFGWPGRDQLVTVEARASALSISPAGDAPLEFIGSGVRFLRGNGETITMDSALISLSGTDRLSIEVAGPQTLALRSAGPAELAVFPAEGAEFLGRLEGSDTLVFGADDFFLSFRGDVTIGQGATAGWLREGSVRILEHTAIGGQYEARRFDVAPFDEIRFSAAQDETPIVAQVASTNRDDETSLMIVAHGKEARPAIARTDISPFEIRVNAFDRVSRNPLIQIMIVLLSLLFALLGVIGARNGKSS